MVVQYLSISDVINDKFTEEVVKSYMSEIVLAIEKTKEVLIKDNKALHLAWNNDQVIQVVVDAVEDLKRIQDFHPIKNANAIKEAAYFGYWLIKRKPIYFRDGLENVKGTSQENIDKRKVNFLFANEYCAMVFMLPKIFTLSKELKDLDRAGIDIDNLTDNWKKYLENLLYFLSYRAESPKAIEAALTGLIMQPKWDAKFDFWKVDET